MQVDPGSNSDILSEPNYDLIYVEAWKSALAQCQRDLERDDHADALQVTSARAFRQRLGELKSRHEDVSTIRLVAALYPVLDHYEAFAASFVSVMRNKIGTSMMWGLLFLVVKLSLDSPETLERIFRMLRSIGLKLRVLHEFINILIPTKEEIKSEFLEVNREIVILWLNIIHTFRAQVNGRFDELAWSSLENLYDTASNNIQEAVSRTEKLASIARARAHVHELENFQKLLSLEKHQPHSYELISSACHNICLARNVRFFGRQELLLQIERVLQPSDSEQPFSSLLLYGMGGVGKTQLALEYAYQKLDKLDTVLWVPAEDRTSLDQSFSQIALETLKLPSATSSDHNRNRVLLLNWLQRTSATWLLVFDNAESFQTLTDFWPISRRGAVILTSRRQGLGSHTISNHLEVPPFEINSGGEFLMALVNADHNIVSESEAARGVSEQLGGHALAINQIAAIANSRRLSLANLAQQYSKYAMRMHRQVKEDGKAPGYPHNLDTVWEMSFKRLPPSGSILLGILCYFAPDSIPEMVFELAEGEPLQGLSFLQDDFEKGGAFESIFELALAQKHSQQRTISIHRLIQVEYVYNMSSDQKQSAFESATYLLRRSFPKATASNTSVRYSDLPICGILAPHVEALINRYKHSVVDTIPINPTYAFCDILCDYVRYLREASTAEVIDATLSFAFQIFDSLNVSMADPSVVETRFFLLNLSGIRAQDSGLFERAADFWLKCADIRLSIQSPRSVAAVGNHGLSLGSLGKYDDAITRLEQAITLCEQDLSTYRHTWLVIRINIAKVYSLKGEYGRALDILTRVLCETKLGQYPSTILECHQVLACVYIRTQDLTLARKHFMVVEDGYARKTPTLKMSNEFLHVRGCIELAEEKYDEAVATFNDCIAGLELLGAPLPTKIRAMYKLSQAMERSVTHHTQGLEMRRNVREKLRFYKGGILTEEDNDEVYESLVKMSKRM